MFIGAKMFIKKHKFFAYQSKFHACPVGQKSEDSRTLSFFSKTKVYMNWCDFQRSFIRRLVNEPLS